MSQPTHWIQEEVLIPDLIRRAPAARAVLDRYGLRGCGGPEGPVETLGFFSRAHDVPLPALFDELRTAVEVPAATPIPTLNADPADAIYRPFFKAGIAVILTLGAVWGAYLLLRIGFLKSFTSVGYHEVNAHGHAQIFGWVGLFVMGFAYQAFPRFKHTTLPYPRLAFASFGMMIAGLLLRSGLEPFAGAIPQLKAPALFGTGLEITAIGIFALIIFTVWRRSLQPAAFYDHYIASSIVWFFIQAVGEFGLLNATLHAPSPEARLELIAAWQAPLREFQIHGFAMLMILGVSQRILPRFFGFPSPNPKRSLAILWVLNAAIFAQALGFVLMHNASRAWAGLWHLAVIAIAAGVVLLIREMNPFRRAEDSDRSVKFIRAAYLWLVVSLAMLVLLPVYQFGILPLFSPDSESARIGFSHAYYGAIRHAVTVGFISLMIVGVSSKVVPTLNGIDIRTLPALWIPFVLLNLGCGLRVGFQTLTDFTDAAFPIAGISGVLEVTGLAFWGVHLFGLMAVRKAADQASHAPSRPAVGLPIRKEHLVAEVIEAHPALLETFLAAGFTPLANPVLRTTVGRITTVESACRLNSVNVGDFLEKLNRIATPEGTGANENCGCNETRECITIPPGRNSHLPISRPAA